MLDLYLFLPPGQWLPTIVSALFGLMIGSFLNVLVYRLPKMMQQESDNYIAQESGKPLVHTERYNLFLPRSSCPVCAHKICSWENIPVVSYLVLRARCKCCNTLISPRYPLVEVTCALLTAGLIWHFGSGYQGLSSVIFASFLLSLALIDYDTKLLPDDLTLPLLWCGLVVNLFGQFIPLRDAVIGAAAGYLILWAIYWLFKLITGKEGMGYGDFKLLAALGAWLGWDMLPIIILLSSAVGTIIGTTLILMGRSRDNPIPFGPYLATAGLVALIYGKPLSAWLFETLA